MRSSTEPPDGSVEEGAGTDPTPAPRGGRFTLASARSGEVLAILALIFAIETVGFHLLLSLWRPLAAWTVTVVNLLALAWVLADYRELGRAALEVSGGELGMRIGRRLTARVSLQAIERAWVPSSAERNALSRTYLDATKPAAPNLLLAFRAPVPVVLLGVIRKPIRLLALCVDDPEGAAASLDPHDRAEPAAASAS